MGTKPVSRPGPEEKIAVNKPNTTQALIVAKPIIFLTSSTGLDRIQDVLSSVKLKEFQGLHRLEPTLLTTRLKLGTDVRYLEQLETQKL